MIAPLNILFIDNKAGQIRRIAWEAGEHIDTFEKRLRAMLRIIRRAWAESLSVEIERDETTVATFSGIAEATPKAIIAKLREEV